MNAAEKLRQVRLPGVRARHGIINAYDVARVAEAQGLVPVVISYTPGDNGRGGHGPYWSVWTTTKRLDPYGSGRREWGTKWDKIPGLRDTLFPLEVAQLVKSELKKIK